jgi:ATP-dependent Clp endopeptidase proteolytic subunit ClpP
MRAQFLWICRRLMLLLPIAGLCAAEPADKGIRDRLHRDRILFIGEPIDDTVADAICRGIDALNAASSAPITIYINSPGGLIGGSLKIIETMSKSKAPIITVCIGKASGTAALILASGNQQFALPDASITLVPTAKGQEIIQGAALDPMKAILRSTTRLSEQEIETSFVSGLDYSLAMWIEKGLIEEVIARPP